MGTILIQTLIVGPELALLTVGMTLVFGSLRFANVAQVEFATVGAYGTYLAAGAVGGGLLLDSVISIAVVAMLAVLTYHVLFVRLLSRSPATAMIGSLALSILVEALIQTIAGPTPKQLPVPLQRGLNVLGAAVTPYEIGIMVIGAVALGLTLALLRFTSLGRQIRAVSANRALADASGVNSRRIIDVVWLISGALGALDGVLLAVDTQVSIQMGFQLLLPMFAGALLGGFGSPTGAVLGGYVLALAEAVALTVNWGHVVGLGSAMLAPDYRPAVGFVLLLIVLLIRPQGLLGRAARRA
jgi:branched-subunit amino acid ABC-type transport system permease component